jgi:hypothetical protein
MSHAAARARPGQDRVSLYEENTNKIITELEAGRLPWVQPLSRADGFSCHAVSSLWPTYGPGDLTPDCRPRCLAKAVSPASKARAK